MRSQMEGDDDKRNRLGLLVSAKKGPGGTLRIVLDRVALRSDGLWEQRTPVSYRDFPDDQIRQMTMGEGDLLSLGSFLLAEVSGSLEGAE